VFSVGGESASRVESWKKRNWKKRKGSGTRMRRR
jgi:hypothetical protein